MGIPPFGGKYLKFSDHQNIIVKRLRYQSGKIRKKIQYLIYGVWCFYWVFRFRPDWIYASDCMVTPIALLIKLFTGNKMVYHEHDSVFRDESHTRFMNLILGCRDKLAKKVEVVVLPQAERVKEFRRKISQSINPLCVWNCASKSEIFTVKINESKGTLKLIYFGSINNSRLPLTILDAMALINQKITLDVIGYETIGSIGYLKQYEDHAGKLGLSKNFIYRGSMDRESALRLLSQYDLGICFMPMKSDDINMRYMVGASNKPFDYLSQGLPVMVNSSPDWKKFYADPGFGLSCNPECEKDIAKVFDYCLKNKDRLSNMGNLGQNKVKADWNYESQFEPVFQKMQEAKLIKY